MRTRARHSYPDGSSCRAARLLLSSAGRRGRRPPTTLPRSRMRLHLHRSASATTSPSSSTLVDCERAATRTNNLLYDDDRDEEPPPEHLEQWQAVQWPEVQRLRRRRALNQYRLQDLPGPLKESAALRRVAAKGVRRDYRLLESYS